ncbi:MAG TPA: sensor histidine kinase [Actinomycetes bacterium]|nr:sensor histidine kinase [Actinomycetes bacterium]
MTPTTSWARPDRRDVAVATVVTVLEVLGPRTGPPRDDPSAAIAVAGLVLSLAQGVPIAWRRSAPEAVLAVVAVAFVAHALLLEPVPPYGAWVALGSLAVRRGSRTTGAATAGVLAAVLAGYLGGLGRTDEWVVPSLVTVAVAVTGQLVRERRARIAAVAENAAVQERLRIARDLHDLLGHSLGGIAVQSSTGRLALDADRPEVAWEALARIEEASRSSLVEVRAVLGALRDAESPGLESVDGLVRDAGGADLAVRLHRSGDLGAVPAAAGEVAYRVVQEALTNARRHAAPCTVAVTLVGSADDLSVEVVDDGARSTTGGGAPAGGHGIPGMRERVEALGGTLEAGPADGAGWRVRAVLPTAGGGAHR